MIKIRIPGEIPRGGALKATIFVGTLGFYRHEYIKDGAWRPAGALYVDPETTSVAFEVSNKPTFKIKHRISSLL
jgi:hypothetical protein